MKKLRQFWRLVSPFWLTSEIRYRALVLLIVVVGLSLSTVAIVVRLSDWNNEFYTALQKLDATTIYHLLFEFMGLASLYVLVAVYVDWLRKKLIIDWRRWMTHHLIEQWITSDARQYRLQLQHQEPENADQRIAEDCYLLIQSSLQLFISFLRSSVSLVSFVVILWSLSGSLDFELLGWDISIPGYMLWLCILYTIVATWITHKIGKPLLGLNFEQQRREADFRVALVNERLHAESVAAQQGWEMERLRLTQLFDHLAKNWRQLMDKDRNLSFFTVSFDQVSSLVPIFAALPRFLSKSIELGGLIQIQIAFGQVQNAIGWFIFSYSDLASWAATVDRLTGFVEAMQAPLKVAKTPVQTHQNKHVAVDVRLFLEDGTPLMAPIKFVANPGELVALSGESGLGKSTLLKAMAGFWPHYEGTIQMPQARLWWLPQSAYVEKASLRELLAYPQPMDAFTQEEYETALNTVGLSRLCRDLSSGDTHWAQRLSGGETQRLLLARTFLQKPDVVLFDESTSALDSKSVTRILEGIKAYLPEAIVIFVSHQSSITQAADHVVELVREPG